MTSATHRKSCDQPVRTSARYVNTTSDHETARAPFDLVGVRIRCAELTSLGAVFFEVAPNVKPLRGPFFSGSGAFFGAPKEKAGFFAAAFFAAFGAAFLAPENMDTELTCLAGPETGPTPITNAEHCAASARTRQRTMDRSCMARRAVRTVGNDAVEALRARNFGVPSFAGENGDHSAKRYVAKLPRSIENKSPALDPPCRPRPPGRPRSGAAECSWRSWRPRTRSRRHGHARSLHRR